MHLTNLEKIMKYTILTSILLLTSSMSNAFSIDKMLLISSDDGNGVFTLTSSKGEPEYIKGSVSQVKINNGELEKIELTKDNLPLWDLALLPNKLILNPGERRRVSVKNLCQVNCDNLEKDKVYQVTFMPSVLDSDKSKNRVGINYGYAPYYIVPAEKANVDYDIRYNGNEIQVENKGERLAESNSTDLSFLRFYSLLLRDNASTRVCALLNGLIVNSMSGCTGVIC